MLNVRKIIINENLLNNSISTISFTCKTHKGFTSLSNNVSARKLLIEKVDYEKLEIYLELFCLRDGIVQRQDDEGMIPCDGDLWIAKDGSRSYIQLEAEINRNNWLKLKADALMVQPENLFLNVCFLNIEKISEGDDCFVSKVKLSLQKYIIEKS